MYRIVVFSLLLKPPIQPRLTRTEDSPQVVPPEALDPRHSACSMEGTIDVNG